MARKKRCDSLVPVRPSCSREADSTKPITEVIRTRSLPRQTKRKPLTQNPPILQRNPAAPPNQIHQPALTRRANPSHQEKENLTHLADRVPQVNRTNGINATYISQARPDLPEPVALVKKPRKRMPYCVESWPNIKRQEPCRHTSFGQPDHPTSLLCHQPPGTADLHLTAQD